MNKLDKKQKRLNWPAIEYAIRTAHSEYLRGKNKSLTRRYYVDGIEPVYSPPMPGLDSPQVNLFLRLLCEPEATKEQWEQWKEENDENLQIAYRSVRGFQNHPDFYFGNNSLFNRREADMEAFFYNRNFDEELKSYYSRYPKSWKEKCVKRDIMWVLKPVRGVISRLNTMKRNPYAIDSHGFENNFAQAIAHLEIEKDLPVIYDEDQHGKYLLTVFCPIEWAHRHPDRFNPEIKPEVQRLRDYFLDEKTHPVLRQAYLQTVENKLDEYVEHSGAGARIRVCLRYDHPAQLQAMLPLLYHETRHPSKPDDPDGTIRAFSTGSNPGIRRSYCTITGLRDIGFNADSHVVIDDRTLLVEFAVPIRWEPTRHALFSLGYDATNLEEKLKARKLMPGDYIDEEIDSAALVYLLVPIQGQWRVGAWARYFDLKLDLDKPENCPNKELVDGENEYIDKIVNQDMPVEKKMLMLLEDGFSVIRKKGHPAKSDRRWMY